MAGSPAPITDQELVSAALQGSRRAFGDLVNRYQEGTINVVYRMCGDPELAQDAAQEALIRAWQRLASYKPQYPFRSWLYRIAINQALDILRARVITLSIDDERVETDLPVEDGEPEVVLVRKQRDERIQKAVLALPDASRAVLVLREYEGLTYQEIAFALNIPVGTVMSRLNYARCQLRKLLTGVDSLESQADREVA